MSRSCAPLELLEIEHDRLVGPEQILDDLLARTRRLFAFAPIFQKRPQPVTDRRRQHPFEILEGSAADPLIVGVQRPERRAQRLSREDQRQQREGVSQPLAGPVLNEIIDKRSMIRIVEPIEQLPAFPYRPADRNLAQHNVENPFLIDLDPRILFQYRGQRSPALEPDFEARILERRDQPVDRALRDAHRKHPNQPAPYRKRLIRIELRIDQLADVLLGNLPQAEHGIVGHRLPRQQRDRLRHQRRW